MSLFAAKAMSGLVKFATYNTPPSMLEYDHSSVGSLSSLVVALSFSPSVAGVGHRSDSSSPAAFAIFDIASSCQSCTQFLPSAYAPRVMVMLRIKSVLSSYTTFANSLSSWYFHH